jgi:saccharopine dehydrogenase-like NADP-dependent oxidoreductase
MLETGLYGEQHVTFKGVQTTPLELVETLLAQLPESKQNSLWAYGLLVEVAGRRGGEPAKVRLWNRHPPQEEWGGPAAYFKNIAIPLSIGAQMIAAGNIEARGVLSPETALDPGAFFAELSRRGIEIHEEVVR